MLLFRIVSGAISSELVLPLPFLPKSAEMGNFYHYTFNNGIIVAHSSDSFGRKQFRFQVYQHRLAIYHASKTLLILVTDASVSTVIYIRCWDPQAEHLCQCVSAVRCHDMLATTCVQTLPDDHGESHQPHTAYTTQF